MPTTNVQLLYRDFNNTYSNSKAIFNNINPVKLDSIVKTHAALQFERQSNNVSLETPEDVEMGAFKAL